MKCYKKILFGLAVGMLTLLLMVIGRAGFVQPAQAQAPDEQPVTGPIVSPPVAPKLSRSVRQLSVTVKPQAAPGEVNPRRNPGAPVSDLSNDPAQTPDRLVSAATLSAMTAPTPTLSFEGISLVSGGSGVPPDTNGDVGPNHYVQMVNSSFAVFNKSGTLLVGPADINALWVGQGGLCESNNDGDPVVLYDPLANRWLLSQFAVPGPDYAECIAVSKTGDPTGQYWLYEFAINDFFPDYPKLAVWPDAYYMSANESLVGAYAFDRTKMLTGQPATYQKFEIANINFMLPSDLDGINPPPPGSPNYFYTFMDDRFWDLNYGISGPDRLEIWEFRVNFTNPAASSFTRTQNLNLTPFNYTVCGYFNLECIPQPAPGERVDAVSEWPMWRLVYRNFGVHQTLLGNFTVDVDGSNLAGIRWFELRKSGSSWSLFQEGTHAPYDGTNRYMGSIAMDKNGDIALGYSAASNTLKPSIRYATRLFSDPPGTFQSEATLIGGGGVQTNGSNRWGDYSAMSIDPADDCTFWYTNEYYATDSPSDWQTRIGAFKIPACDRNLYFPIIRKK